MNEELTPTYGMCSVCCGRYKLNKDGTVRKHSLSAFGPGWHLKPKRQCTGSNKPPRQPDNKV